MRLDLTDLRVFLHAFESGSMTEAAARSHLTLAAVSARIRALEDNMGVALLNRHRRGVSATQAGALLARHASVVFHQLSTLQKDLAPPDQPMSSPTVVLGNSSALARPLAATVAAVLRKHPQARIAVRESGSEVTVHALQMGAADIGLISDATRFEGLTSVDLGPDPLLMVAVPEHPLAGALSLPFEALLSHEWVGWSEGSALHTHLAMQAFKAGSPIRYKVMMPSADEVLALVAQGLGIAVLPAALVASPAQGAIATVPLSDDWARRRHLMCCRPGLDNAVAASLMAALKANWPAVHPGACRSAGSPAPSRPPAPGPTMPRTN